MGGWRQWFVAFCAAGMVLSAGAQSTSTAGLRPAQARAWDAWSRLAYLSGEDGDWDGLNDGEESCALALWGAVERESWGWVDETGAVTLEEWSWSGIDDDAQELALPFAFPWNTQYWSHVWVGVNGTLGFVRGQPSGLVRPLPDAACETYPMLAVFWRQLYLDPDRGGKVWYASPGPDRFVVCWQNLQLSNDVHSCFTFQAELHADGHMIWRYQTLDAGNGSETGGVVGAQWGQQGWWLEGNALQAGASLRLSRLQGGAPDNPDSDGDGIPDGIEFYYFQPWREDDHWLDPGTADNPGDIDRDGLDVVAEYLHGRLDPFYWDTDGDLLGDGYEVSTRLLATDAEGIHGTFGDGDNDGLTNLEERLHRTQPRLADSDGDLRPDGLEVAAGADPLGAWQPTVPGSLASVSLALGDPAERGATEAYAMQVESLSGDLRGFTFQNSAYGMVQTQVLALVVGAHYRVRIEHLGSVRSSKGWALPDYEAGILGVEGTVIAVTDPENLLGRHLAPGVVAPGTVPLDPDREAELWVQARIPEDGTAPVVDPLLQPHVEAWMAGRASTIGPVPESQLHVPGVLVLPEYLSASVGSVAPCRVRMHGLSGVQGVVRRLRFDHPELLLWRPGTGGTMQPLTGDLAIGGALDTPVEYEFCMRGNWSAGHHVNVEYQVCNLDGQVIASKPVRLLGPLIFGVGDSMTYGVRRRRDGTMETPNWGNPWLSYPSQASWNSYYGHWADINFQGSRGFLRRDLSAAIPWIGHNANGHGPNHCGYSGSRTYHINDTLASTSRPYPRSALLVNPSYTVVLYWIGLNDTSTSSSASAIFDRWKVGFNQIVSLRAGRGRTLIVGVTLPPIDPKYAGYSSERQRKLYDINTRIRRHTTGAAHVRYVVADIADIRHEYNDDGLHFMAAGYSAVSQRMRQAIVNGLRAGQ